MLLWDDEDYESDPDSPYFIDYDLDELDLVEYDGDMFEAHPLCDFGQGDEDGICVRAFELCYHPTCPWADQE